MGGWWGDGYHPHRGGAAGEGRRSCEREAIGHLSLRTDKTGHRRPMHASDWWKWQCKLHMHSNVAAFTLVGTGF